MLSILKKFLAVFFVSGSLLLSPLSVYAQAQGPCAAGDRNQGLISGISLSGFYGNPTGQCVNGTTASYASFKVPSYNELKSVFFTQNKTATLLTLNSISSPGCPAGTVYLKNLVFATNTIVNVQCTSSRIDEGNATGQGGAFSASNKTVIIFADTDFYIDSNINYGGDAYGLIIIAKGNINISANVTTINALLVSEGNIYTTTAALPSTAVVANSQQLTVNGSIISLAQNSSRIYFNRSLNFNSVPAEIVNYQPKFLVLLRGLLTQSYTIQREIGADEIPPSALFPSPTTIVSPAPSENPGSTFQNAFCVFNVFNLLNKLNIASDTNVPCS